MMNITDEYNVNMTIIAPHMVCVERVENRFLWVFENIMSRVWLRFRV